MAHPVARFSWILLAGVAGVVILVGTPGAYGQSVDMLEETADGIDGRLSFINSEFVRPMTLSYDFALNERLADARLLVSLEQYERASLVLLEIVENDDFEGRVGYEEARFLLAESLFHTRQFSMARSYYQQIIAQNDRQRELAAARRLLEIAFAMKRYDGLDELYQQLQRRRTGVEGPDVAYVRGKALYFQGRHRNAIDAFEDIGPSSELFARSRYLVAVSYVRMEDYDAALSELDRLTSRLADADEISTEDRTVLHLSYLAEGRIHYEMRNWTEARAAYADVPPDSEYFDDALFEICWTLIREERYPDAIDRLQTLAVLSDDERFLPEARLLIGDLEMRRDNYEQAITMFEDVRGRYGPLRDELVGIARRNDNAQAFFDAMVDEDEGALQLPVDAQPWVETDADMIRALALVRDLALLRSSVDEANQILREIDVALNAESRVNLFPRLREGWGRTVEVENDLLDLETDLVEMERRAVWPALSETQRASYEAIRGERIRIGEELEATPRTYAELSAREDTIMAEYNDVLLEVHDAQLDIRQQEVQARELLGVLSQRIREGYTNEAGAAPIREEIEEVLDNLEEAEDAAEELSNALRAESRRVGVADSVAAAEQRLKEQYRNLLGEEESLLRPHRDASRANDAPYGRIDALRERVDSLFGRVDRTFREIDQIVAEQTVEAREALGEQQEIFTGLDQRLARFEGEGQRLAGEIAYRTFLRVHDKFDELNLRASLGIIDVAWRLKEEETEQIDILFDERNEALRILDADFAEILQDE